MGVTIMMMYVSKQTSVRSILHWHYTCFTAFYIDACTDRLLQRDQLYFWRLWKELLHCSTLSTLTSNCHGTTAYRVIPIVTHITFRKQHLNIYYSECRFESIVFCMCMNYIWNIWRQMILYKICRKYKVDKIGSHWTLGIRLNNRP